jgi:hypothetical protein
MDLQRKTIQSLTVGLDEKREELSAFYRQFGTRLFNDSADPVILAGALSAERVDTWQNLMNSRANDAQAISEIKAALTRQQELNQFRKELNANLSEEKNRYNGQLEELGRAVYDRYSESDAGDFAETYEKAAIAGNALAKLEDRQDQLHRELDESGFFGKMFVQFKMAGLASNIRQHKARFMRILSEGAEAMIKNGFFEKRAESGELEGILLDRYSSAQDTSQRLNSIKQRSASLDQDFAAVTGILATWGASENPLRRVEELRVRIRDTDKRIDSLVILSAREYSDKFLDDEGKSLLGDSGDGHTFSDMGAYAHQLEQIASLRSSISVIRRRIEVLETAVRIDSLDRNIAAWDRNIADCERKIQHFRELSESLAKNIHDATEERERLREHKEAVEKTLESIAE